MLNAYISKDEILKLLESSECIDGMINKREFQQAILEIKEHKKPKKEKKSRVNNADFILANIAKYRNNINIGSVTSYIKKEIAKNGIEGDVRLIEIWIVGSFGKIRTVEDDIVFTLKDVSSVLGISIPTANEWKRKKIIVEHSVQRIDYRLILGWVVKDGCVFLKKAYSINEIESNLKHYKPID